MEQIIPSAPSLVTTKPKGLKGLKWNNKYFIVIGGVALTAYGISWLVKQQEMLKKTCFKPKGFVPVRLALNSADINVKFKMKNESKAGYYLKNQIYNIYINDQFVGVIKNPNRLYIVPEKSTDVWLNVKFNPLQVANISWGTLKDLIANNSDVKVQIKGNAKVIAGGGVFAFNYPVDETFTLSELIKGGGTSETC
jgi:LEA14-like dessication related protein